MDVYRQCLPRIVKDIRLKELVKREYVSSVITIAPVLKFEIEKMCTMRILLNIDDGV